MNLLKSIFLVLTYVLLASCSQKQEHSGHSEEEVSQTSSYTCPMHPEVNQDKPGTCPVCGMDLVAKTTQASSSIMLTNSQVALANIKTEKVSVQPIGKSLLVNGRLVAAESNSKVVTSRIAGRIDKMYFKETGASIKKGKSLYEIFSEDLQTLQREYLLAWEQYSSLGKEQPRYKEFYTSAHKKLLLYGLTENQVAHLRETKTVPQSVTFFSPASGYISTIATGEGQYVEEGQTVFTIDDISTMWVEAELYTSETARVKIGDKVGIRLGGFEDRQEEATVTFLSPEFRAGSQINIMRAVLKNPTSEYKPGMQADVFLTSGSRSAITIPLDAVLRDGRGSHVYIVTGTNTFEPRMVKTGTEDFNLVEITSGITEGEEVVVSGAYLLYSEVVLKKGGDPMAGHQH
jgi:membrane fusion protein, copper/silver efflux system